MPVDSKHPAYTAALEDWTVMRDTYDGQRRVKEKAMVYLPATAGQLADGMAGEKSKGLVAYKAYRSRAVFPDLVSEAVESMIGVMHNKPAVIELPAAMEPMIERATLQGESLQMLLRRINEEQLVTGRVGLLLDLPDVPVTAGEEQLYIAMYRAETIINWDVGRRDGIAVENLNFLALDETEAERQEDFEWETQKKYRILILGDPKDNEPKGEGVYRVGVFREEHSTSFDEGKLITPNFRGTILNKIPFVFVNSKDVVAMPDNPPLLGLANTALTIYRGEADYRQTLFMQGQDTLVLVGVPNDQEVRVGADSYIVVPVDGDAKYVGVRSEGLPEMREALENDYNRALQKAGQLLDTTSRERESGDALKVRVAARTATLNQVALAGAYALEQLLRIQAEWMGLDPETVTVTPNLDFADDVVTGKELTEWMTGKTLGGPISLQSIHKLLQDKGATELDFEEEMALIEEEQAAGLGKTQADRLAEQDALNNPAEDEDEGGEE